MIFDESTRDLIDAGLNANVFGSATKISDVIKPTNGVVLHGDKVSVGSKRYVPENSGHMSRRDYLEKVDSPIKSLGRLGLLNSEVLNTGVSQSI